GGAAGVAGGRTGTATAAGPGRHPPATRGSCGRAGTAPGDLAPRAKCGRSRPAAGVLATRGAGAAPTRSAPDIPGNPERAGVRRGTPGVGGVAGHDAGDGAHRSAG